ncbi:Stp1/IreP family PP2C-type Ser/Thr phosphatase [uncultured Fibrella sp.]|uniref:Stp1/IreP family PP2C-type Ser/Thr phosphatase n=1 Tax=uncultured Fibrella sp. TaxID=1284596 RepID=UPI0035CBBF46
MPFWKRTRKPAPSPPDLSEPDLRAVVLSDVGCVRDTNEDAARFVRPTDSVLRSSRGCLAVLADGMGGHAAGEVASNLAVETVAKVYYEQAEAGSEALRHAVQEANRVVYQRAETQKGQRGMGTTCTAMVILGNQFWLAQVGDSRAYRLHDGQATQLTIDHTHVRELIDQQLITLEEARQHPDRNVLTRALGTRSQVVVDTDNEPHTLEFGERLLLCSDGLYEYFTDAELAELASTAYALSDAARQLVDTAKLRGGHDNLTVLLIERVAATTIQSPRPTESFDLP